jgi:glycosyltransferase involved in cell wall biosynthesis
VLTEHSINYKGRLGLALNIYRYLRKRIDVVIACSEEVRSSHLPDLEPNRLVTVYNGVDLERFYPGQTDNGFRKELGISERSFVIGHVGNLTPQKGQVFLLRSIKKLLIEELPIILVVAGDGPLRRPLESMAKELGISESVRFLGQRSDLPEILRSIDVLAGASLREGFPISVLEAMASGKPVVTTNVGGNKEAVLDGVTGFIVSPENPDELASALKRVLLDEKLRQRMGNAARRRVEEHFSAQKMVKKTEELYETLLRAKRSS